MPGYFQIGAVKEKVAFTSTGFASPPVRGSGASALVMDEAERRYATVVATGNSPSAVNFFRKRGYSERESSEVLELDSERSKSWLQSIGDTLHPHEVELHEHHWRQLSAAQREEVLRVLSREEPSTVVRTPEAIAWMLNNPWFPPSPKQNRFERAYRFGNSARAVDYRIWEVRAPQSMERAIAVVAFVHNATGLTLKVLDYGATHKQQERELGATLLMYYARNRSKIRRYLYPARLGAFAANRCVSGASARRQLYFFRSSSENVARHLNELQFSSTDGDTGFW
jgi:hypothetical protein